MDTAFIASAARWLHERWDSVERFVWFREKRERIQEAQARKAEADARIAEEKAKQEACQTLSRVVEVSQLLENCEASKLSEVIRLVNATSSPVALPVSVSPSKERRTG